MDLVMGPLGSVLSKLAELLKEEYNLQTCLADEIRSLSRDLESMHAALRKVAQVPWNELDEHVKLWARDIREVSYDAEDILDTFLVRVQGHEHPEKKWYKRAADSILEVFGKTKARHEIARMIKVINEKAKEVETRRGRYRVQDIVAKAPASSSVDPRLKLVYKDVAQLVGMEKPSSELESILMTSSQQHVMHKNKLKIVSVVGFGGIGKTTLAKVVYDKKKSGYDCSAFVSVGQNPALVDLFKKIIFLLSKEVYETIRHIESIELLSSELQNFLRNKRYLIVVDDIWEIECWETIEPAFVEDSNESRIIITTRKAEVAPGEVYKLEALSYNNSRRLFYKRVFGGEDKCPNNYPDRLSNNILEKCGGVPLAIITMASLLLGKSREEWFKVSNSPGFYRNKDNRHVENTKHILALSYYDLPSHLKTCLLYLSVFPEDTLIGKDSLIWKWIAEGFVEKKPGCGLFEVGEEYFRDLINRNMIQGVDSKVYGILDSCHVHDMVLDLIVSMSREENFAIADGTLSQSHTRRLALKNRKLDLPRETHVNLPHVRSFVVWRCHIIKSALHPRLKLIRVLALEHCKFREGCNSLEDIENLRHLRYLRIRHLRLGELPEGIGNLKFLQTLDLKSIGYSELPCSIGRLTQLVCLRAPEIRVPDGVIGKLTSLEELQIGGPHGNDESKRRFAKDLGNLCELRVLKTDYTKNADVSMQIDLVQSLGNLQKMQHLTLGSRCFVNMNAWDAAVPCRDLRCFFLPYIWFPKLPSWINSAHLSSLSHLEIHVGDIGEQGLKALGELPELCYLNLKTFSMAIITSSNTKADGCFQKLRSCVLPYSMLQFVANEDSSASFVTICDILSPVSRKKDNCSRVGPTIVMPNLEEIDFAINVKRLMKNNVSCEDLGLEYLPLLSKVKVNVWCSGAFEDEVEREEAALRHAIQVHANRPALQIEYFDKQYLRRRSDDDADSVQPRNEEETE